MFFFLSSHLIFLVKLLSNSWKLRKRSLESSRGCPISVWTPGTCAFVLPFPVLDAVRSNGWLSEVWVTVQFHLKAMTVCRTAVFEKSFRRKPTQETTTALFPKGFKRSCSLQGILQSHFTVIFRFQQAGWSFIALFCTAVGGLCSGFFRF